MNQDDTNDSTSASASDDHKISLDAFDRKHAHARSKQWDDFQFFGPSRCQERIEEEDEYYSDVSRFADVLSVIDDRSWQGMKVMLVKQGKRFGLVSLAYGSCPVCDDLESARETGSVDDVVAGLLRKGQWFDSLPACVSYASVRDWEACEPIEFSAEPVSAVFRDLAKFFLEKGTCDDKRP